MSNRTFWTLSIILSLVFAACKPAIDPELTAKIQELAETTVDVPESAFEAERNLKMLLQLMGSAPDALKALPDYSAVSEKATALTVKHAAVSAEYADMNIKLTTLARDYSAGKMKTGPVKQEFETVKAALDGLRKSFTDLASMSGELQAEYGKLSAAYKLETEEE